MCFQPFLERIVHARLPTRASITKSGQYITVKADGNLLFGAAARRAPTLFSVSEDTGLHLSPKRGQPKKGTLPFN